MLIDILDGILTYIRANSKFATEDDIKGNMPEREKHYFERAILMIEKDGYVFSKDKSIPSGSRTTFYISFEGLVFLEQGGYRGEYERNLSEAARLASLESRQAQAERNLLILNSLIAFGTLVAAVYYVLEILRHYKVID